MSNVFCMAPFVHSYIHAGENSERVCCQAKPYTRKANWDLSERWHGEELKDIRQQMLQFSETPTDYIKNMCFVCLEQEAAGDISDRIRYNERFNDIDINIKTGNANGGPIDLDLRPSNLCNLQCRMCWSGSSSQIEKEIQRSERTTLWFMGPKKVEIGDWSKPENIDFLFKNADKSRRLKFLGGEPTIMPEVHDILDMLIDNNITDIPLSFTTNLTNVNKKFMQKLEKFTCLSVNYSIDGTGKTVEYIRYPVDWDKIKANILEYEKIATMSEISYTLQAYNVHNMKEFMSWADSVGVAVNVNVLTQPEWDSVYVLPREYREKYLSDININSTNHILKKDTQYSIINFIRHTKILDQSRNHHIKDYLPELWELIEEEYNALQI